MTTDSEGDLDEIGPIDWMLIEFNQPLTGAAAPPLIDLVDRGLIRILDIMIVRKSASGEVDALEISAVANDDASYLSEFVGAGSGLLGEEDLVAAGEALENDTRAVFLIYENSWAAPFATAIRKAGGQMVDQGRIPVNEILAALEEMDAEEQ